MQRKSVCLKTCMHVRICVWVCSSVCDSECGSVCDGVCACTCNTSFNWMWNQDDLMSPSPALGRWQTLQQQLYPWGCYCLSTLGFQSRQTLLWKPNHTQDYQHRHCFWGLLHTALTSDGLLNWLIDLLIGRLMDYSPHSLSWSWSPGKGETPPVLAIEVCQGVWVYVRECVCVGECVRVWQHNINPSPWQRRR